MTSRVSPISRAPGSLLSRSEDAESARSISTPKTFNVSIASDLDICNHCNNEGLEGISFDHRENIFWVVKELDPRKVVSFSNNASITSWDIDRSPIDFSGIYFDDPTHHILLLSHESETLFEYAPGDAAPLSKLPLEECFEHVKTKKELEGKELKAEGVTMDHARNIYIIGEPDFLCKFEPK